ncbi:MAG: PAS domain S-box protein [Nitrospirae bacterium]|nr:PAS domain S-box protein [Nitrospirota bacterium]
MRRNILQFLIVPLIVAIIFAAILHIAINRYFIHQAKDDIMNILLSNKGFHLYIQKVLHPAIFSAMDHGYVAKDFYNPQVLSSSYIVRTMHGLYNEERQKDGMRPIYYKMAANNPRNPVNKADEREAKLIKLFNENPSVKEYEEVVTVKGEKYLYYAIPFLKNEQRCMRCHGNPEDAPIGLRKLYPLEGGFHEKVGEIRAVESMRVPIEKEAYMAFMLTGSVGSGLFAIIVLFFFNTGLRQRVKEKTKSLETEILEKEKAKEDLKASEENFRTLFDKSADAIFIVGEKGEIIDVNEVVCIRYKYNKEELRSMHVTQIDSPEHAQYATERISKITEYGSYIFDTEHITKDGKVIPTEVNACYVRTQNRSFILSTCRDVTERKRSEEEENKNRTRLVSLVNILQYPWENMQSFLDYALSEAIKLTESKIGYIYHYDEDRRQFILNSWSKDVMKECSITKPETCYELDNTGIWGEAVRQRKEIIVNDFEAENSLKKGYPEGHVRLFKYMTVPVFNDNRIIAVVGVANKSNDYTQIDILQLQLLMDSVFKVIRQKKAEEALTEKDKQYRSMMENSPAVFYRFSTKRGGLFYSPKAAELFGCSIKTLYDNPMLWSESIHPDDKNIVIQAINDAEESKMFEVRYRLRNSNGDWRWVNDRSIVLKRSDDDLIIEGIVLDITEHKNLENQLRQSQKMEAIGTLAGGVAHDFNNILQAIIGFGTMAQKRIKDDEKARDFISEVLSSADRAAELTKSLLAFSRKQTISLKQVDLNSIVKKMHTMLVRVIGEDIELNSILLNDALPVLVDSSQIEQVLLNLATNARDAMADGGHLVIQTEEITVDKNYAEENLFESPGRYALLTVSDTGIGMDKKTKENIFEPFFTTKGIGKGTGLGLAMVYGIVKQHGGNIIVYSELGKGTTFKIYLPLANKPTETLVETDPAISFGKGEIILVAEDDERVRKIISLTLQEYGYKIIEAISGEDAVMKFLQNKDAIELLLLDVIMPIKNGKEAYEEISKHRSDIKTIFMSGYTDDIISRKGILKEGFEFISKPINPIILARKVREVLDK